MHQDVENSLPEAAGQDRLLRFKPPRQLCQAHAWRRLFAKLFEQWQDTFRIEQKQALDSAESKSRMIPSLQQGSASFSRPEPGRVIENPPVVEKQILRFQLAGE